MVAVGVDAEEDELGRPAEHQRPSSAGVQVPEDVSHALPVRGAVVVHEPRRLVHRVRHINANGRRRPALELRGKALLRSPRAA